MWVVKLLAWCPEPLMWLLELHGRTGESVQWVMELFDWCPELLMCWVSRHTLR